jgi:uracil-DNA glycosylase
MKKLSASPSARTFAELWKSEVLTPTANRIAGSDNKITAAELKRAMGKLTAEEKPLLEPSLQKLAAAIGSGSTTVDEFVKTETARILAVATQAAGSDGRLSKANAEASELGPAFNFLRTGAAPSTSLASDIPEGWRAELAEELEKPYFKELDKFVTSERASATVFPPKAQTFAALSHTPLEKVRVVVIGQDPYPTAGNANGLAFSVSPGVAVPGSLKNIYKNLEKDLGTTMPTHGNLEQWADQGVLLLNTVLTVREGEANSHQGKGWEEFTKSVLAKINEQDKPVVFLLLGNSAQKMAGLIDTSKHSIVAAPHPSPLNAANFMKSQPFSAVNTALSASGRGEIDWQIH